MATQEEIEAIALGLTPLQSGALHDCCQRGGTRTNDGGLYDTLLSGMCSNTAEGIDNGWLVKWTINPSSLTDNYINLYAPTPLGLAVWAYLKTLQPERS